MKANCIRRWLRGALAACLTCAAPLQADEIALPDIGDSSQRLISPLQERALGEASMRQLRSQIPFIEDPEITTYIRNLGHRLARNSDAPQQPFTFFILKEDSINAFAAPGGYIGIHSGLILAARSESELAGVMAHEIAHVTQRHLARAYDSASRLSLPTAAAILAAILVGTQDAQAGQAALMSVQAASIQQQINFTRSNEYEADWIGMQILARSGLDPMGMPAFFQRLRQATRYYGRPPPFLSTHPVTTERISNALARIDQMEIGQSRENPNFRLIQAKLRVLTSADPKEALAYYLADNPEVPTEVREYGLAQARLQAGEIREALVGLKALRQQDPDRIAYRIAYAQALAKNGDGTAAARELETALRLYPGNPLLTRYYAETLLTEKRFAEARQLLETELRKRHEPDALLYRLLARAAAGAGDQAGGHEAMAEYHYLSGRLHAAIEALELALKQPGIDHYQKSRMEARLKYLKGIALAVRQDDNH